MVWVARALILDENKSMMESTTEQAIKRTLSTVVLETEGGDSMMILRISSIGNLKYSFLKERGFSLSESVKSLRDLFAISAWEEERGGKSRQRRHVLCL